MAGAGAVVRHGYLRKLKTMKRKYFVLREEGADCSARLEYYESEKKFRAGAAPRRVVPLRSCFNVARRLDLKQRHVIALYTKEEQFCVVAEGEDDLRAWLADLLRQHAAGDAPPELLHPTQHVWQVNVQKKGLGASKNIIGLYNLCLTDKTLTLVKIRPNNNTTGEQLMTDGVEFSLRNIRRCGDSECFFYMEVGRQTATGAGELWMHTDDANIALSMHHTIYNAMCNCKDEKELQPAMRNRSSSASEDPRTGSLPPRRSTYSDGRGRAGLGTEKSLCVGSCIKQCVCSTTYSIDESAASIAPLATNNDAPTIRNRCDSMPSRTCPPIDAERTPSRLPSTNEVGDIGHDEADAAEWPRAPRIPEEPDYCDVTPRTNMYNRKLSLSAQSKAEEDGYLAMSVSEPGGTPCSDTVCSGTPSTDPRFSEYNLEPATAHFSSSASRSARAYSVGSRPAPPPAPERLRAYSVGARTRAVRSTPSKQHNSNSAPLLPRGSTDDLMELDFSNNSPKSVVIMATTPPANSYLMRKPVKPKLGSTDDLMELDFSNNSPKSVVIMATTPPANSYLMRKPVKPKLDEYVDMSPRASGYVEMKPSHPLPLPASPPRAPPAPAPVATTPDGYVEMNYGKKHDDRTPSRPISIAPRDRSSIPTGLVTPDNNRYKRSLNKEPVTPLSSQTIFPFNLDSPASPMRPDDNRHHDLDHSELFDDEIHHHPLTTVREISEECGRKSPDIGSPPHYVTLPRTVSQPIAAPPKITTNGDELSCNPTATKIWAGDPTGKPRFTGDDRKSSSPAPNENATLNYAALDLEQKNPTAPSAPRAYTQIDFARSEKLHAGDAN
ncbi:hypothetical protein JYU34_001391 [Plutella xylostella]|uniref:Insulin receptor substrate 1 n=1 Tax=Plutella xylostella TaxID=51655 RepID=A0ABQ7R3V3_PLUXY|nr:hypothetical protein JYU34_001391 [Plutella xylostella]